MPSACVEHEWLLNDVVHDTGKLNSRLDLPCLGWANVGQDLGSVEAVVISDNDQSIDLSEIPDLSAELPEKNDDDKIRKRTFH